MNEFSATDPLRVTSYRRRLARTRERMQRSGIDLLVAYGNGRHSFVGMNPAWWLTGFKQMGPHMAVLVTMDADPWVVVTPRWDEERAIERSAVSRISACEPAEFLKTVARIITENKFGRAKSAVSGGQQMPRGIADAWGDLLGSSVANADPMFMELARPRDEWSLHCTRAAVDMAEKGYDYLLATARPGMREHVVAGELEAYLRGLGAEDNFQLMSASQHNRSVHKPTDRILEAGDILLGEITPAVEGEYIQICRTAVFGEPTPLQRSKFNLLDTALRAGMAAAKPGAPITDVVSAINEPIAEAGYGKYTVPPYMRTRGHSMSLGSMDPEIATFCASTFEKNSVFVMHPNQYLPDTGYFMCGEPVIITDEGAKPLTSHMGQLRAILN
jgi:Xaa-Pro dipeptidase